MRARIDPLELVDRAEVLDLLSEHLREFSDGKLHQAQKRDDAQARGIGKRLESVG